VTKSEQARADAMADAETLRLFASHVWDHSDQYCDQAASLPLLLDRARGVKQGGRLSYYQRKGRLGAVAVLIADAAHAAFQAVPGLRGTEADEKALHGALCLRSEWLDAPCECGIGI